MTVAIIDADMLIYKVGFAIEKRCYILTVGKKTQDLENRYTKTQILKKLKDNKKTEYTLEPYVKCEPLSHALHLLKSQVKRIQAATETDSVIMTLTSQDKSNFRFEVATTEGPKGQGYKAGRSEKPKHFQEIRDYIVKTYNTKEAFGMEADDLLSILQCDDALDSVLCAVDKDLDMVPGAHYNFNTDVRWDATDPGKLWLTEDRKKLRGYGVLWFYAQMLMGDSTDNIPGVGRYGPVAAYGVLASCTEESRMFSLTYDIYRSKFKDKAESRYLEVADLLWMLRKEDEFKSKDLKKRIDKLRR